MAGKARDFVLCTMPCMKLSVAQGDTGQSFSILCLGFDLNRSVSSRYIVRCLRDEVLFTSACGYQATNQIAEGERERDAAEMRRRGSGWPGQHKMAGFLATQQQRQPPSQILSTYYTSRLDPDGPPIIRPGTASHSTANATARSSRAMSLVNAFLRLSNAVAILQASDLLVS